MTDKRETAFCLFCVLTGYVAPWAFILAAAVISLLPLSDAWQETAAWLAAIGFALLCASYFFARAYNRLIYDQRDRR